MYPNSATFALLDLQKWLTPQIKGLITAMSEMFKKNVLSTQTYLERRKHVSVIKLPGSLVAKKYVTLQPCGICQIPIEPILSQISQ